MDDTFEEMNYDYVDERIDKINIILSKLEEKIKYLEHEIELRKKL